MRGIDLTDEQIQAMTPAERRALIDRLERPVAELVPSIGTINRIRRLRLGLMIGGSVGLIPWIVLLSIKLPNSYMARNWAAAWVGFDVLLVALMALTAILGWQRRQLLILSASATGVLLICDAWFDIMTAAPEDIAVSVTTAVCGELPLAAILIGGTLRLIRLTASRFWLLQPDMRLWQLRIPL